MANQWVHGSVLYYDTTVEVREVSSQLKNHPRHVLGWQARIMLPAVEMHTPGYFPTQAAAERALVDGLARWIGEDAGDREEPADG